MRKDDTVEIAMIAYAQVYNGKIPWTMKKHEETLTADGVLDKFFEILPIFTVDSTEDLPRKSNLGDRQVESVMYELHNLADELYPMWETFQLNMTNKINDVISTVKFIRTDVKHTSRVYLPKEENMEVLLDDLWGSTNRCLVIRVSRPF